MHFLQRELLPDFNAAPPFTFEVPDFETSLKHENLRHVLPEKTGMDYIEFAAGKGRLFV